ncbi:alpha/beta fold hydrolase [Mycolicibacterium sp. P1-18]|uniref:alpha/beta fold hydrolase n=1 Tax=Mycolicibacterium sp. P1-18 TaxID=2024615 RepID=UPI0011F2E385|nr:alpha/beta fold hydrolase [Mycolicibacterium sp. P1-18]KAA0099646.1 alpha/beta fold hydrolase [Mycolicibacterium sp. P1-18]
MVVTNHRIDVPLDWSDPTGPQISVHAREVVAAEHAGDASRPPIVWFQGGPGHEVAFPDHRGSWLEQLLTRYRVVLMDQRGTGLSTPLDARSLPVEDATGLGEYLRNFRQDSIVRDADRLRATLFGEDADWYVFGQSFGGFCSLTYLSYLPEHLRGVIITGGFAPVLHETDDVCVRLFTQVASRNVDYYARFPADAPRVRRIVDHLEAADDVDGRGQRLSARRFLMLGSMLGLQHGAAELHGIVERADNDLEQLGMLSGTVHEQVASMMSPATNPIYTVLHEAAYSSGPATGWAAERARRADPRFALDAHPAPYFTGEAVFPWMMHELPELTPLREVADDLATHDDWPPLYDIARLEANTVPVVGTVYWDDAYVERTMALETVSLLGNCSPWITNEFEHGAYRHEPRRVADRLFALLDDLTARG